jgi:hypothetical protein
MQSHFGAALFQLGMRNEELGIKNEQGDNAAYYGAA